MAASLPTVEEAFEADISQFVAAMHQMRDEVEQTGLAVEALQELINELHGKTVDIGVDTMGAGFDAMRRDIADMSADLIMQTELLRGMAEATSVIQRDTADSSADLMHQTAILGEIRDRWAASALAAGAYSKQVGDSGTIIADAGTRAWQPWFLFGQNWKTALHWIVAGGAELLAVTIPALVATGGAAAVMAQGVTDAKTHLTAMYDAQEATANMAHKTVGDMLGLGHALQAAQNAADPHVFELLGAGINIARTDSGLFVKEGTQVVGVLDNFAAKVTADMQGAFGQQLHSLLGGGVKDLTQLGQVAGDTGHAVLNLASDMPGLAHVLLDVVDGASKLVLFLSGMPGHIFTAAMAFEEFNRWGSLVVGMLGRVTGATTNLQGGFFTLTRAGSVIQNLASVFVQSIGRMVGGAGNLLTKLGSLWIGFSTGGKAIGAVEADAAQMGGAFVGAGTKLSGFGSKIAGLAESITPLQAAIGIGAVGALGFLIYKAATAKTVVQQLTDSLQNATLAASNLHVYQAIGDNLAKLVPLQQQAAADAARGAKATSDLTIAYGRNAMGAADAAKAVATEWNPAVQQQMHDLSNVAQGVVYLSRTYGTTYVGALALADQAGVKLAAGINGTGAAATANRLKIANYVAGMQAMGAQAGTVGHDVTLLGIDAAETATKVGQLHQAFSDFIGNMVGGTQNLGAFNQALTQLTKGSNQITTILGKGGSVTLGVKQFAEDLTRFTGQGAQAWQNFDSVLTGSASQLVQWFQTAGSEGAVKGPQFTKALLDMASSFTPLASKSQTAQKELVGFFNAAGLNVKSFADLKRQIETSGASGKDLAKIVQDVTGKMSNLNGVAKQLGSSIGSDVVGAMNQARIAASGLGEAAQNLAGAWYKNHSINSTVIGDFRTMYARLMDVYHNTGLAKGAIDAYAQQLGMTKGQISALNGMLNQMAGDANHASGAIRSLQSWLASLHSKTIYVRVDTTQAGSLSTLGDVMAHVAGGRQAGGPVMARSAYMVGEAGRELFVPDTPGRVYSNPDTERFLANIPVSAAGLPAGGGGGSNSGPAEVTVHSHVYLDGQQIFNSVKTETARYNVRNGNPQSGRLAPG